MNKVAKAKSDNTLATELILGGAEIAGGAAGAAIGLLGGPLASVGGTVIGIAAGRVLSHIGAELKMKLIGPREIVRVGAAAAFAGKYIADGLSAGTTLRDDGFFDDKIGERASAEAVLEGVLLKARDSYEEKKLEMLGVLYANIAFHPEVSSAYAYLLIKLIGELTYRQLVIMEILYEQTRDNTSVFKDVEFRSDESEKNNLTSEGVGLLTEAFDIYQRELAHSSDGSAWLGLSDTNLGKMRLQGSGVMLAQLAALQVLIAKEDREEVIRVIV